MMTYGTVQLSKLSDISTNQAVLVSTLSSLVDQHEGLKRRVTSLENGSHPSTKDRYTFEDSKRTIENLKEWAEATFVKK